MQYRNEKEGRAVNNAAVGTAKGSRRQRDYFTHPRLLAPFSGSSQDTSRQLGKICRIISIMGRTMILRIDDEVIYVDLWMRGRLEGSHQRAEHDPGDYHAFVWEPVTSKSSGP